MHAWGFFLAAGAAVALVPALRASPEPSRLLLDAVLCFGATALLYSPWLPVLLDQAAHTGAPWLASPGACALLGVSSHLLGASLLSPLVLAAASGVVQGTRQAPSAERTAISALLTMFVFAAVLAWAASQYAPSWAPRYFALLLGPLLVAVGVGLARAGRLGLVALAVSALVWLFLVPSGPDWKSNTRSVARTLVRELSPRGRLVLVRPVITNGASWTAPWTILVRRRSSQWSRALRRDTGLVRPSSVRLGWKQAAWVGVQADVFEKTGRSG